MSAEFAGALSQRVTLLRRAADRDDLGGASGAWASVGQAWASLRPMPPAAWGPGDRPVAPPRWRAWLRCGLPALPGDRLQWRARLFAVRGVEADPAAPDRQTLMLEEDR